MTMLFSWELCYFLRSGLLQTTLLLVQDCTSLIKSLNIFIKMFFESPKVTKIDAIAEMIHVNNLAVYGFRYGQCPHAKLCTCTHTRAAPVWGQYPGLTYCRPFNPVVTWSWQRCKFCNLHIICNLHIHWSRERS